MMFEICKILFSIHNKRITNPSSKSSPIDRRTSRRREEDDPSRDESPPLESSIRGQGHYTMIFPNAQDSGASSMHRHWDARTLFFSPLRRVTAVGEPQSRRFFRSAG
ncbi:unnamed protein product [Spirodela intermedia]|uniref:Uncharacterized protein n=1 Tax=Spirodela intermedia TaxID=51605 RepID=A0ABN7E9S3_SPIIN|nr:unnamed protein product [Spirodela intermedia]